jgi:hypothetical protein
MQAMRRRVLFAASVVALGLPLGMSIPAAAAAEERAGPSPSPPDLAAVAPGDPEAARLARELWDRWKILVALETPQTMNGGYRGRIRLEPAAPVFADRRQLAWIVDAVRDFDSFFVDLAARRGAGASSHPRFRFVPIELRFTRSVGARTPSAYAHGWTVGWNLAGSLHTSSDAVRETLFHELFHSNDDAHAAADGTPWSIPALGATFDAVVARCGTKTSCLAPYSPNDTMVRGGTFYSFQPGNGVREYAAELALRYYREQRAVLRGHAVRNAFKCGPPENERAWRAMRDEFFGGIDVVPPCR